MSEAKRDFYGDLIGPEPQQAGVSAYEVAKLLRLHSIVVWDDQWRCRCSGWALGNANGTEQLFKSWAEHLVEQALATAPPEQAAAPQDSLLLTARCTWINDITYMKRIPGTPRTEAPCLNEGYAAIFDSEFPREVLCKYHYDGKVYRKEDVSGYRLLSKPDQPQAASGGARSPNDEIHFQEGRLLGLTEGMQKCEELLAAHDRKVRAEVREATLREVKKIYDDGAVSATVYNWLRSQLGLSVGAPPAAEKP